MSKHEDLIGEAIAAGRIYKRWTEHGGADGTKRYVIVEEADYAQLWYAAQFAPCESCGKLPINVRHDLDGDRAIPRHAYIPPTLPEETQ